MSWDGNNAVEVLSSSEEMCLAQKADGRSENQAIQKESAQRSTADIKTLMQRYTKLCCCLQNTKEMSGIVNNLLMPYFDNTDEGYLYSEPFYKLIHRLIIKMETTNEFRFTNLKKVILNLKTHQRAVGAGENSDIICIDTDTEQGKTAVIDLADINSPPKKKRKVVKQVGEPKKKRVALQTISKNIDGVGNLVDCDRGILLNGEVRQKLSVSCEQVGVIGEEGSSDKESKVKSLEIEILNCVAKVKQYERREVDLNNPRSVYIECDRLKVKILSLYEEIMTIKKCEPEYKRVLVKLAVPSGQPSGPARRLEAWLNKDATYSFPDFHDVVRCVATANIEDNIGWTNTQVLSESRRLFRNCGEQLQRRRQEREWRYLQDMSCDFDNDPADTDPELKAKLEKNMIIAKKKEKHVVDMFADAENFIKDNNKKNSTITFDTKENKLIFSNNADNPATAADDQSDCSDYDDGDDDEFQFVKSNNDLLLVKREEVDEKDNSKDIETFDVDEEECDLNSVTIIFDSSSDED